MSLIANSRTPKVVALLCVLLLSALALAQTQTGSIVGAVSDPQGAAVPGAHVRLISEETGVAREVASDDHGNFTFTAVLAGSYRVEVEHTGFRKYQRTNVVLEPNGRLSVGQIDLALGMATESVTVTAEGAAVQTASSERSGIVTSEQVQNLTIISRDFAVLGSLQPGVVYNSRGAETQSFSQSGQYNVNGGRVTQNSITIDGIPVENSNVSSMNTFISLDAVSQVKIQTSNFQAEFGRKPAGGFQAVTKSGTVNYHGGLYWNQRNEAFNGSPYTNSIIKASKVPYRFITAGATFGGPVYIPKFLEQRGNKKLFFFFNWEEQREVRPQNAVFVTVPTQLERSGDFSQSLSATSALLKIIDPTTGQQFAGNKILPGRINAIGQAFLNQFPQPTTVASPTNLFNGKTWNYFFQESLHVPKNAQTARIDYNLTPATTIHGVYNGWWDDERGVSVPAGNSNWGWLPSEYNPVAKTATLGGSHIFSPTLILESSLGFSHWTEGNHPSQALLDKRSRVAQKIPIPQLFPTNNPLNILPQTTFGGIDNAANASITSRYPITGTEEIYLGSSSLTKVLGAHTLKAGVYYEHWYEFKAPNGNFTGTYDFSGNNQSSNYTSALGNTNDAYANALLGNFFQYTESTTRPPTMGRYNGFEWYGQDSFKVNRRLTLDLGMRFGYSQPFHPPDGKEAGFNPALFNSAKAVTFYTAATAPVKTALGAIVLSSGDPSNGTVVRTSNSSYPEGLRTSGGVTFGPRVGFSFDPFGHGNTAIRGGFGMFYDVRERDNFQFNTFKNPPLQQNPIVYFGNFGNLASGANFLFPSATSGFQEHRKKPYVMDYSLGVQQSLGFKTVLDVSYVGNAGRHLWWQRNVNSIPAGTVNPYVASQPDQFYRPYAGYLNIQMNEFAGTSNYNALQASLNRRFSKQVVFGLAYTWSHAMGYADDETQSVVANQGNYTPRNFNYGSLGFDHRQLLKGSWTWDLPKVNRAWNGFARGVLDDWKLSGIMTYQAGQPLGINVGTITAINPVTGKSQNFSATQWSGSPSDGTRVRVMSYSGGRNIVVGVPAQSTLGNATKFIFPGPPIDNWDMALAKQIPMPGERVRLLFNVQAYNIFNHPQFTGVDQTANFTVDASGAATQTNANFLKNNVAGPMRRLELALRLSF